MKHRHFQNARKHHLASFLKIEVENPIIFSLHNLQWVQNAKDLVLGGVSLPPHASSLHSFFFFTVDLQNKNPSFPGNFCHYALCEAIVWICLCYETCRAGVFHRDLVQFTGVCFTRAQGNECARKLSTKKKSRGAGFCKVIHCSFLLCENYLSIICSNGITNVTTS